MPLSEIRKRYPVTGLAKRMSIVASDLLGKSVSVVADENAHPWSEFHVFLLLIVLQHDELVLALIQLHREKTNLETIRECCIQILDNIDKQREKFVDEK